MSPSVISPTEQESAQYETGRVGLRTELVKRVALGGGLSVGAAVVLGAFELLKSEPHEAFPLLKAWGPGAFISLLALWAAYDLARAALNIGKRGVIAMERTAVALSQIAGKDDRQLQELQTLTAYTSQESERNAISLREVHEKLDKVADSLMRLIALKESGK